MQIPCLDQGPCMFGRNTYTDSGPGSLGPDRPSGPPALAPTLPTSLRRPSAKTQSHRCTHPKVPAARRCNRAAAPASRGSACRRPSRRSGRAKITQYLGMMGPIDAYAAGSTQAGCNGHRPGSRWGRSRKRRASSGPPAPSLGKATISRVWAQPCQNAVLHMA